MTVCIAAICRSVRGTIPALVLCCDERGDRGLVSADDSDKIKWPGPNTSVMLAGAKNSAEALYEACLNCILSYDAEENPDDTRVARLKHELEECARGRKRAIVSAHVENTLHMSLAEFNENGRARFGDAHFQELLAEHRMMNLGAHMLVCTFSQDNGVIFCVTPDCEALLQDNYCAIGSGGPIAAAFYVQRPYGDDMPLRQCIYRVLEAKVAAEKNAYVGDTTVLEIVTLGRRRKALTEKQFGYLDKLVQRRLSSMPKLPGLVGPLEAIED